MDGTGSSVGRVTRAVLKPRVSALLASAVEEITSASGSPPTPEEVVWLHQLCERQVLPSADDPPPYLPQPVELQRGLVLYPLTMEAQMWLDEYVRRWWPVDDLPAVAYAMAHCGGGESPFPGLTNRARAKAVVWGWWWTLRENRSRTQWAVLLMAGRQDLVRLDASGLTPVEADAADPLEWGEVIARLSSSYHQPPRVFLQMSMSMVVDMYRRAPRLAAEASGLPGGGEHDDPARLQAFAHLRMVVRYIIRCHRFSTDVARLSHAVDVFEDRLNLWKAALDV